MPFLFLSLPLTILIRTPLESSLSCFFWVSFSSSRFTHIIIFYICFLMLLKLGHKIRAWFIINKVIIKLQKVRVRAASHWNKDSKDQIKETLVINHFLLNSNVQILFSLIEKRTTLLEQDPFYKLVSCIYASIDF